MPRKNFGPTQVCKACGIEKSGDEFDVFNKVRGYRSSNCRSCRRAYDRKRVAEGKKKWKQATPEQALKYRIKYRFGISVEKYNELLIEQGGVCAICGLPPVNGVRLVVDHDHRCCKGRTKGCGKCVRGLLHVHCNTAIGWFQDSPEIAMKAVEYLRKYQSFTPIGAQNA